MPEINPFDEIESLGENSQPFLAETDQFEDLMSDYLDSLSDLEVGQLAKATVIEVKKDYVLLDVGDKAEGIANLKEFLDYKGNVTVQSGDQVEVVVESRDQESGQLNVSYRKARQRLEWNRIVEAFEKGHSVHGHIVRALKNGVLVDAGIPCFLPASQLDLARVEDLQSFVGQDVECYVIDVDRQRRRGVLSRRKLLSEEQDRKREEFLNNLQEGATVEARVKSVLDFGVFVDMGGMDGLIPREEVAWEKRVNPAEILKVGVRYKFKVMSIDREKNRVTLSRRQTKADPWQKIEEDYTLDLEVRGNVVNLTNNCAYVLLADGIEGRIHRDNLSWNPNVKKPSDILKKGGEVAALVLGYDREKRLLELGLKQMKSDPWSDIDQRFPIKSRHSVTVADVVSFGAFVQLDDNTKGLIHVSDMSYDKALKDPKQFLKVGDEVEAVVLKIDKEARRINFGMKQLDEDPFVAYTKKHPTGTIVTGIVRSVTGYGAFIELAPNLEGLIHVTQWSKDKLETLEGVVAPGDEVTAKILKIEKGIKKISLSRRTILLEEERSEVEKYKKGGAGTGVKATTSLGSLLKDLDLNN